MSESSLTIDVDRAASSTTHDAGSGISISGYEIISTAQELLAADGKDKVEEVAMYLEELRVRERERRGGGGGVVVRCI